MYSEIIRLRLIEERKTAGYTQEDIANKIGEPRNKIAKIECGLRTPDVETVGKLANFYGIPTDYFYGLGQSTTPPSYIHKK